MKICPHCATRLEEDSVKCPRCGKWVVQKRAGGGQKGKISAARKHRILIGAMIVLAWAVWRIPIRSINPREILDLNPNVPMALAAMESDLETLKTLQARHFRLEGSYSGIPSVLGFEASEGVNVSLIVTPTGWSASATHEQFPSTVGCAVFEGSATPPHSPLRPAQAGAVECTGRQSGGSS